MILLSYINARNEEIILDDTEKTFLGELYGREGTEAPALKYSEILYGDGSTEIVTMSSEPRDVTFYFWAPAGTLAFREKLEELKQKLLQTGVRSGGWGKLKIRRPDGTLLYLNSVYTGGLDDFVRESPKVIKFSLTFRASDPLFYNIFQTRYIIQADAAEGYLMMHALPAKTSVDDFEHDNSTDNPSGLYMKPLTDPDNDTSAANPNSIYMRSAANESSDDIDLDGQKVYPTITITGSAKNIRIYNALTGKKIEFSADVIVDGDTSILIETKPLHRKVVAVNAVTGKETSIIGKLTADSSLDFYLERGVNTVYFRNSEATPESKCIFTYTEGYLSAE